MDLRHLPNLRIFAIHSLIRCDVQEPVVLDDIKLVLSTIPNANQITKLSLDFIIYCEHPFVECLEEDWAGMCDEVVRVSAGKPLELDLEMSISSVYPPLGQDELYECIKEKHLFQTTQISASTFGILVQQRRDLYFVTFDPTSVAVVAALVTVAISNTQTLAFGPPSQIKSR